MAGYHVQVNGSSKGEIEYTVQMMGDTQEDTKLAVQEVVKATRGLVDQLTLTRCVTPQTQI